MRGTMAARGRQRKRASAFFFSVLCIAVMVMVEAQTTITKVKLKSPAKSMLKAYEIVRVEDVIREDENVDVVKSFAIRAFGERFEVELVSTKTASTKGLLRENFQVLRFDGKTLEEDEETRELAKRAATKCQYKGFVKSGGGDEGGGSAANARPSRVSANVCAKEGFAHVALLAKNMSLSLMMPHESFREEVEEAKRARKRRKKRRKILNNALDENEGEEESAENEDEDESLESVDFIAFNAADEVAEHLIGTQRDRIKFMPSKGDEEEEANDDDNKKRRKLQAIDYANTRVIEVYAHNDETRVSKYNTAFDCVMETISIMNYVSALYENAFYPDIEIVLKVIGYTDKGATDPWGTVQKGVSIACPACATDEVDSDDLLTKADDWKYSSGISMLADADVLSVLSGHNFDGGTIGLAYTGGACKGYGVNVNEVNPANSLRYSAATVAHEIGHNLGFLHDGDYDDCPDTGLIMAAKAGYELETEWSTCTVAKYSASYFAYGCLAQGSKAVCGNGIVEEGEECDCFGNDCSDADVYGSENTCCNAATCMLKPGIACSSYHDGCCDSSCVIKSSGSVCRDAVSTCDVQETCDGASKSCVADGWKPYGTKCHHGTHPNDIGSCYKNECRNQHFWCQQIDSTSHGGSCVSQKVSFPESVCSTTAFRCYGSASSCNGPHDYSIEPEKGYPCSSVPLTTDGVFAKVCDGYGGCVAPDELNNLRGPYITSSVPVGSEPNVNFDVNEGFRKLPSYKVVVAYFAAMVLIFAEVLLY